MSRIITPNQPCPDTDECGSSDALQIYEEGDGFCFSCSGTFSKDQVEEASGNSGFTKTTTTKKIQIGSQKRKMNSIEEINSFVPKPFAARKVDVEINEFYGVKVSYNSEGIVDTHYYPYNDSSFKVRNMPKSFTWINKSDELFGRRKFSPGGKRVYICEGEMDTLSVAQALFDKYGRVYPCVGIASSTMTDSVLAHRDWLRSFDEVIIVMDQDEPGAKAEKEITRIVGFDKAKIATLTEKDAGEVLVKHGSQRLMQLLFDAARFVPSGIIGKDALWDALVEYNNKESFEYPPCLEGLNGKLKGMREGEIALFISGTGSGKSTMLREVMLHILDNTKDNIGVVSLEESPAETARKLASMVLNRNSANETIPIEELKPGFDKVFASDRVILLDHQGSIGDLSIIDQLEYMALSGCKYLFIDHITILVSEGVEKLTGNEAQDKIMNALLRLVKRYPIWIGLVSHLRKVQSGAQSFEEGKLPSLDDIRGSGSIKQISFDIIAFARDMVSEDEKVRNTIKMSVLKSRFTGLTGVVTGAEYNYDTGRLSAGTYKPPGDSFEATRTKVVQVTDQSSGPKPKQISITSLPPTVKK